MTGVQRFAFELVKNLNQLRSDITVLVPNKARILDRSIIDKMNILEIAGGNGHYWEQAVLPKYLKSIGSPLLINLCNSAPILYKNKISTHHDITYIRFPQSYSWKFRLFYRNFAPLFLKTSHAVITVSEFSKKDISDFYKISPQKIHVIANAVNESFEFKKDDNEKDKFALAVSSPNYHKNFYRMIEAYNDADINFKIKIIGSASGVFNDRSPMMNEKIDTDKIEFVGRVTDEELIALYQNAEFFIFPSLYEGFGIPPLEAQKCGCPVISSNAASLPDVLRESTIYFDPLNVDDIKNKIELVSSNSDIRNELITKGLANVERFSWIKSATKLNELINSYDTF
ncbi:glycosyltransferase family 4 protein [Acinetobacter pollinis]|uniref:glycosyltransferase family 4 protein n=1 Tax=Acinetobacter pollinis TaxID=2605270 RepID=UPI001B3C7210|nr:glycosyltransferase family 1 protein [Acinetobacter pollinis]